MGGFRRSFSGLAAALGASVGARDSVSAVTMAASLSGSRACALLHSVRFSDNWQPQRTPAFALWAQMPVVSSQCLALKTQ